MNAKNIFFARFQKRGLSREGRTLISAVAIAAAVAAAAWFGVRISVSTAAPAVRESEHPLHERRRQSAAFVSRSWSSSSEDSFPSLDRGSVDAPRSGVPARSVSRPCTFQIASVSVSPS